MFIAAMNLTLPDIDASEMEYLGTEDDMDVYKVTDNTKIAIYVDGEYVYKAGITGNIEEIEKQFIY